MRKTTRPDTVWREEWPRLSKKHKRKEIAKWEEEETRLHGVRRKGALFEISLEDEDFLKVIF